MLEQFFGTLGKNVTLGVSGGFYFEFRIVSGRLRQPSSSRTYTTNGSSHSTAPAAATADQNNDDRKSAPSVVSEQRSTRLVRRQSNRREHAVPDMTLNWKKNF